MRLIGQPVGNRSEDEEQDHYGDTEDDEMDLEEDVQQLYDKLDPEGQEVSNCVFNAPYPLI